MNTGGNGPSVVVGSDSVVGKVGSGGEVSIWNKRILRLALTIIWVMDHIIALILSEISPCLLLMSSSRIAWLKIAMSEGCCTRLSS